MTAVASIIDRFPRRVLADASPVQRLRRLEQQLESRVEIYIKRDDLLRPLFGNKLRYLEYVLGAYDATGSDCLIHCGGKCIAIEGLQMILNFRQDLINFLPLVGIGDILKKIVGGYLKNE